MEYSCFQFCGCGDGISYALILKSEVSMLDLIEEEGGFFGKAAVIFATAMYLQLFVLYLDILSSAGLCGALRRIAISKTDEVFLFSVRKCADGISHTLMLQSEVSIQELMEAFLLLSEEEEGFFEKPV